MLLLALAIGAKTAEHSDGMLLVALLAYVVAAAIAYVWCAITAKPIPFPNWIWEKKLDEQQEDIRRAA